MRSWFSRRLRSRIGPAQFHLREEHAGRQTRFAAVQLGRRCAIGRHRFAAADAGGALEVILIQFQLPPSPFVGDDRLTLKVLGTVQTVASIEKKRGKRGET